MAVLLTAVNTVMTSTSSYEPIATESENTLSRPSPGLRQRFVTIRRLFLFAGAFCLVAIAVYKAGQWSIESQSPGTAQQSDKDQQEDIASLSPLVNSSDMPRDEKYSVG